MRKNSLLLLLLLVSLLLSACGQAQERSSPYRIYLISKSTSTEFWRSVFAGANAARAEYNVELTIYGPETEEDYLGQNRYIEEAIQNREVFENKESERHLLYEKVIQSIDLKID